MRCANLAEARVSGVAVQSQRSSRRSATVAARRRPYGLTRFELLGLLFAVGFGIIVIPPALRKVRRLSWRATCAKNLADIGKAMIDYSNDYNDAFPRAGGRDTQWGAVADWSARDRGQAFGLDLLGSGGHAGISSCFYLLVKYEDLTPKSLICQGDAGTTEFRPRDVGGISRDLELIDVWDFGPPSEAYRHCSYAYHIPFGSYALTVSNLPGMAVAADRNPWTAGPAADRPPFTEFRVDLTGYPGNSRQARTGNAVAHQSDGQNVLFVDSHVEFAKRAYCGVENDNIYTISANQMTGDPMGVVPEPGADHQPANRKDSVLVSDLPPAAHDSE